MSQDLPTPQELLQRYGRRAKKRFGQNFLSDPRILDRIVAELGDPVEEGCIEVGPGPGGLTTRLLRAGWGVRALELDVEMVDHLREAFPSDAPLEVTHGDALGHALDELWRDPAQPVVANLPYHVATPILFRLLDHKPAPPRLVLMFQREVADRIVNTGQSRGFSSLGVAVGLGWDARLVCKLPPGAFTPPPKVHSAVVLLTPRETPWATGERAARVRRIAQTAFQQRRKMLRRSLRPLSEDTAAWLEAAGLPPEARPEELRIEDFVRLADLQASIAAPGTQA